MDKFKVLFHLDEEDKTGLVLQNIGNLIIDLGQDNLEIEMVANSEAVKSLVKGNKFESMYKELVNKQLSICACANTMRNLGIQKEELPDFVTVISSGVGEIVKKQAAGWSYIRP